MSESTRKLASGGLGKAGCAEVVAVETAPVASVAGWETVQKRFYTGLLLPSLILLTLITILPVLYLIVTSFTPWNLSRPGSFQFNGLTNYTRLLTQDDRFWHSVWIQIKLSLLTVPAQVVIGLALALYLYSQRWLHTFLEVFRNIFIIPMVIPPIVAALIWRILFTPQVSIIDYWLGLLGLPQPQWLGDPDLALIAIAIAGVWEFFPFCLLLLYAGLQSLPEEPLEAARIDGASSWQLVRHVIIPMLRPTLGVVILFRLVDSIRAFPLVFVMTQGGPGFATEPTNYYAYQQGFSHGYVGFSSALIVLVLLFTIALTVLLLRSIRWQGG